VVRRAAGSRPVKAHEPFMTGFLQNNNYIGYIGQPVDVPPMKDGSLWSPTARSTASPPAKAAPLIRCRQVIARMRRNRPQ
jgi:hypothetical protein